MSTRRKRGVGDARKLERQVRKQQVEEPEGKTLKLNRIPVQGTKGLPSPGLAARRVEVGKGAVV